MYAHMSCLNVLGCIPHAQAAVVEHCAAACLLLWLQGILSSFFYKVTVTSMLFVSCSVQLQACSMF